MSEAARIANQLHRAFYGKAWHGDSLLKILDGVTAAQAVARPIADAHNIWELVLHIAAWDSAVLRCLGGKPLRVSRAQNFPAIKDTSDDAWRTTIERAKQIHDELVEAVAALPDSRLAKRVPGKGYDFYRALHGAVQHELYHAGQIALLKKTNRRK